MWRSTAHVTGTPRGAAASMTLRIMISGPQVHTASKEDSPTRRVATPVTKPRSPSDPSSVATATVAPIARNRSANRSSRRVVAPSATVTEAPSARAFSAAGASTAAPEPPPTTRIRRGARSNGLPYGPRIPIGSPARIDWMRRLVSPIALIVTPFAAPAV